MRLPKLSSQWRVNAASEEAQSAYLQLWRRNHQTSSSMANTMSRVIASRISRAYSVLAAIVKQRRKPIGMPVIMALARLVNVASIARMKSGDDSPLAKENRGAT